MRKIKIALTVRLLALMVAFCAVGRTWAETEVVDGITWTYTVSNGEASLGGGSSSSRAIPMWTAGAITIPSTLGGYSVTSIGEEAFKGCLLTSVNMPNSLESIGDRAFFICTNLLSVTMSDSVTSIGQEAFRGCTRLTSLEIGNGVESIGGWAFYECRALESIQIPSSVTSIGEAAFSKCKGLTGINIPVSVTNIAGNAFAECSGLTDVVIPNGITSIEAATFWKCTGLTSVTIPVSITNIGLSAFWMCNHLTSVMIPESVVNIGESAFSSCSSLTSVTFEGNAPSSVGSYAFSNIGSGCIVRVPQGSTGWDLDGEGKWQGMTVEYYKSKHTVTFDANGGTLVEGSRKVDEGDAIGELPVPTRDGCEFLGWYVEETRIDATYVVASDITAVAQWKKLPVFTIEDGVLTAVKLNGATEFAVPDGVTAISSNVFMDCETLTSIAIPSSVANIGESAFAGCANLTQLHIEDVAAWCRTSFGDGTAMKANFDANPLFVGDAELFVGDRIVSELTIPEGVTNIAVGAFMCGRFSSVSLPSTLLKIGDYAFYGCTGLQEIVLNDNLCDVGRFSFAGCSNVASVEIPSSLRSIGTFAFHRCDRLERVKIASLETWFAMRFGGSWANPLEIAHELYLQGDLVDYDISIPDGFEKIGFMQCACMRWLKSVEIPDETSEVGRYSFYGCESLADVVFSESVEKISEFAFGDCRALTNMAFRGNAPVVDGNAFYGVPSSCVVRVRRGSAGWGVAIPGTWQGLPIEYLSDEAFSTFIVVFDANGGECSETSREVEKGGALGALPAPVRDGYQFNGWYTAPAGGKKVSATTKVTGYLECYAQWSASVAPVVASGCELMGTVSGGGAIAAGNKTTLKATANKGFVFAGWYLGDDPLEGDVDYRTATYPYVSTGEPTDILAKFVAIEYDVSSLKLVNITNCTVEAGCAFTKDMSPHVVSHSIPKLAVTGLPAGLKYDAKTMKISGVCTKPGVYTVKVAATNASVKKATDDTTQTFTINVKFPKLTLTVGSLPEMSVDDPSSETNLLVGAYIEWPINAISPSATVASMKVSGLPAGLKFTAKDVVDPKTKQVTVNANTIYGRPTAVSKMDKYGKPVPSVVKIAVTTTGKTTINYTVNVTIDALPNWLTGAYVGVGNIVENNRYEVSYEIAGTVSANGKLSATVDYIYLDLNDGTVVKMRGTLSSPGYSAHYDSITQPQAVGWLGGGNAELAGELVGAPCFYYKDAVMKLGKESSTVNLIAVADDYNDSGDKIGVILGVENAAFLSDYAGEFVVQDSWKRTDLADKPVFASGTVRKTVQIPYSNPLYSAGVRSLDVRVKSGNAATVKVSYNFYGYKYEQTLNAKFYPVEWKDGAFECLAIVKSPEVILPVPVTLTPNSSGKISGSGITIDLE